MCFDCLVQWHSMVQGVVMVQGLFMVHRLCMLRLAVYGEEILNPVSPLEPDFWVAYNSVAYNIIVFNLT